MTTAPLSTPRVLPSWLRWPCVVLLLCACSSPPPKPPAPGVVAQVDSLRLQAEDLRLFAARAPAEGDTPAAQRQSYLRGMIVTQLLQREARDRGLDTTSAVRWRVDSQRRQRILRRYRNEVVWSQVHVPEAMVRAYFDSLGLGHQRQVSGILVESQAEARNALSLLRLGRSFAEVATQRSTHRASAAQGGALGYVSLPQARALGIPDSLYRGLEDDELSPILSLGGRYQIVRFHGGRTVELGEFRAGIAAMLQQHLEEVAEGDRVDELAVRLHWRIVPGALALLHDRIGADGTVRAWQLAPEEANAPLFTYDGGYVTLGEYLEALWGEPARAETGWGMGDSTAVAAAARENLQMDRLFVADAEQLGLDGGTDDREGARLRKEMLIELRRQVLRERVGVTSPAAARRFYETHPELFRKADDIVVVEAFVKTKAEARQILAEVAAGASFLELAGERTLRDESLWETPGTLRLGEYERLAMSGLYNAARTAEIGVVSGPVEVHDGFSIFQVVGRQPGPVKPFAEVEERALALARNTRNTEAFDSFVDELLEAHQDEVQVYPTELEAALPDTLLRRLSGEPGTAARQG